MKKLLSPFLVLCLLLSLSLPAAALEVEDAKELLQTYYVDQISDEILAMDALDDILTALGDPYTVYLSQEEYEKFMELVDGETVVGIGVSIQTAYDNGYQILSILPDSPALEAGLTPGDTIIAVDGTPLSASVDPTTLIRGEAGSPVTLTIRHTNGRTEDFTLLRQAVPIPIVTFSLEGTAGVISCDSFGATTISNVAQAITTMEEDAALYIMDLRSNPGGTSQAASGSAGLFIGSALMAYFRDGSGTYNYVYTTSACPDLTDKPLIVLTSAYSASGSELFSAAIRDHGAGIALGQRTFGKGVAQYVFDETNYPEYFDGDCLKITVYRFFSPDGATNDTVGVIPTLVISPENTPAAALLLSCSAPQQPQGYLRLNLAGQTFYIDLAQAQSSEYAAAFAELLEALPPSAALYQGAGGGWTSTTPDALAAKLEIPFTERSFSDIQGVQFETAIRSLAAYRLLSGYEDGTFRPEQAITRAEFCAMVAAALDLSSVSNVPAFSDVPADAWYAGAVNAMTGKGFLSGYGDGTFRPNQTITYEEMVCVLNNVAAWASMDGYDYSQMPLAGQAPQTYGQYSAWAQLSARNLDLQGALVGDLAPQENCTRQVAAGMLYALMDSIHLLWN